MKSLTLKQLKFLHNVISLGCKWSINPDSGLIDVRGNVEVGEWHCDGIMPVSFGHVSGNFIATALNTLKGSPIQVDGFVRFFNCPIKEIDWLPEYVVDDVYLNHGQTSKENFGLVITQMEILIERGIKFHSLDMAYYIYRDAYYEGKLVELI